MEKVPGILSEVASSKESEIQYTRKRKSEQLFFFLERSTGVETLGPLVSRCTRRQNILNCCPGYQMLKTSQKWIYLLVTAAQQHVTPVCAAQFGPQLMFCSGSVFTVQFLYFSCLRNEVVGFCLHAQSLCSFLTRKTHWMNSIKEICTDWPSGAKLVLHPTAPGKTYLSTKNMKTEKYGRAFFSHRK